MPAMNQTFDLLFIRKETYQHMAPIDGAEYKLWRRNFEEAGSIIYTASAILGRSGQTQKETQRWEMAFLLRTKIYRAKNGRQAP